MIECIRAFVMQRQALVMKTGALAGLALCSNMTAICSNTYVYVGFKIFALCGRGVVLTVEATRFLSVTGVGLLISVAVRLFCHGVQHVSLLQQHDSVRMCPHLCLVLVGFEPTRFLSATGIGIFDRSRERYVPLTFEEACCCVGLPCVCSVTHVGISTTLLESTEELVDA